MMLDFIEITNPFPGLRPFEMVENNLFFGRDGQSDQLLERLRRTRFLAVVGTSGSGKSSLIRAGLLPALYGGLMGDAGSAWRIAIMRPGSDPIGNLAVALSEDKVLGAGDDKTEFARRVAINRTMLRRSTLGLVECVRQARMAQHENLLIVVDQFEELFRFKKLSEKNHTDDDAAAFVKLLLEVARSEDVPVYVVLTMRSDFLGDCAQFWGLPEAINSGQYLIPRMTRDERREAITGPVAVGGGEITPPLVNRLLNDMGDNPDHLPTLQHALMRSWDFWTTTRRDGEPLDLKHYEAVGGMANALSKHADEAYDELAGDDDESVKIDDGSGKIIEPPASSRQKIAERLFKSLTEKGADNREIRRPTRLGDICAITGASEPEVIKVIDTFRREGRSFLMPPAGVALDADSVIDISHESLIRGWVKLKKWVNEEAESARIYRRLSDAATRKAKGREEFWGGPNLLLTLDWRDQNQPNAAWAQRYKAESDSGFDDAIRFLEDSRADRDAKLAESERHRAAEVERERQELERAQAFAAQQAQAARRLRGLLVALFAIALLAFGTAGYAWTLRGRAKQSELQAKLSAALAVENERLAKLSAEVAVKNEELAAMNERRATGKEKEAVAALSVAKEAEKRAAAIAVNLAKEKRATDRALSQVKEQARIAAENAKAAEREQAARLEAQRAQLQDQEQSVKSAAANKAFRDATATYQRDPGNNASEQFIAAVDKFKALGEFDGVAASYLQLGYIKLNSEYAPNIPSGVKYFDDAADTYLSMNDLARVAETNDTAGDLLLRWRKNSSESDEEEKSEPTAAVDEKSDPAAAVKAYRAQAIDELLGRGKQKEIERKRLAAERYKRAIEYFNKAGDKENALKTLLKLVGFYGNWDDAKDKRDAVDYYRNVVETMDTGIYADEFPLIIGLLYYDLSDDKSGDEYFNKFIRKIMAGRDSSEGAALKFVSQYVGGAAKNRAAIKLAERAAQAFQRDGEHGEAAEQFETIAEFYRNPPPSEEKAKNPSKALAIYEKARAAYQKAGDVLSQAEVLSASGDIWREQGYTQSATDAYSRSLELYRAADDSQERAADLSKTAKSLIDINNTELALGFYQESLKVSQANKNVAEQADTLEDIGLNYSLLNQPADALKAYQQAAVLYRQLNLPERANGIQGKIDNLNKAMERQQQQPIRQGSAPVTPGN